MTQLVDRAERLGAGESRFQPLVTGIGEVDRVSEVLARSAHQMTRSLASERDFASDASHQLRTPLTALLMRLEEIAVTDDLAVVQEEASIAIAQVERLTTVVDEPALTDSSRSRCEAADRLAGLGDRLTSAGVAAGVRAGSPQRSRPRSARSVGARHPGGAVPGVVDASGELLAHGRGTVDVEARRSGPSVVVEVSDQGDGVPSTIAPHIFERSVSTAQSTGLGLALARDLAEANGGRLELIQTQPAIFALFLSESDPVSSCLGGLQESVGKVVGEHELCGTTGIRTLSPARSRRCW